MDPVVVTIARLGLALLLAAAATHKLRDPRAFRATLGAYQLVPPSLVALLATLLSAFEVVLAAALLVPASGALAAVAAGVLLALYSAAIAANLARGRRDIDCGCLGPGHRQPLSAWLLVRNGVLMAGAALGAMPPVPRPLGWIDLVTIAGALAALTLLFSAANQLGAAASGPLGAHPATPLDVGNGNGRNLGSNA